MFRITAATVGMLVLAGACTSGPSSTSTSPTTAPSSPSSSSPPSSSAPARAMPPGPSCIPPESGKGCLPIAAANRRVDLNRPSFSDPLRIDNPLHPSSTATQVVYGGQVDGKPFRTEFTRLPAVKDIRWEGQTIKAVTWQYLAFSDGRIQEVALDWFAQADDGSVWYLGEDVFNYEQGAVADTHGTWLAGRDGPPAMIMPARPTVGAFYRPENAPSKVFEEVQVRATGRTVQGPRGSVPNAILVNELHMDGSREDKTFAPGYGEFSTGTPGADLEAVSLAIPIDSRPGPIPATLTAVSSQVDMLVNAIARRDWPEAAGAHRSLLKAWTSLRSPGLPALLNSQMSRDLAILGQDLAVRHPAAIRQSALRVAQNNLDLRLQFLPLTTIESARFALWKRQIKIDADASDPKAVAGDLATLTWTWSRVRPQVDSATAQRVDNTLKALKSATDRGDLRAAIRTTTQLP